ncbi:MAG: hypothetical protein ACE5IP_07080 [Terriglobia bacterium]
MERSGSARILVAPLVACLLFSTVPPPAAAWEAGAHRLITAQAIETLPFPLRTYFESNQLILAQLCADPSRWGEVQPRPEHGFIHLDHYGSYPFAELPRDFNRAARKFGSKELAEHGILPWQIGTYTLKLEEAFRDRQWDEVKLYAAILARYVAEAHDPFNTTLNFTGELSNQLGVDSRYASSLVERYQMFFLIAPRRAYKIEDSTAHAFGIAMEANTWVDNILFADSQARADRIVYNDEYFDAFYEGAGAILVRQLTDASQNVGNYWLTAWENAGRPTLPVR